MSLIAINIRYRPALCGFHVFCGEITSIFQISALLVKAKGCLAKFRQHGAVKSLDGRAQGVL